METFIWKFHSQSTEYPEGTLTKLGNSYTFASEPRSVDQRTFKLMFKTLKYYTFTNGLIDVNKIPNMNMGALEAFYTVHRMWKDFIYPHPVYGNVIVKFSKPLVVPQGMENGGGALQPFGLEFMEQP